MDRLEERLDTVASLSLRINVLAEAVVPTAFGSIPAFVEVRFQNLPGTAIAIDQSGAWNAIAVEKDLLSKRSFEADPQRLREG